jgi:hypothetical protein
MSREDVKSDELKRRALRLARKGESRKAALALRERASLVDDAASWVMAGAMFQRANRQEDALAALRQGMWMHERAGSLGRARSVATLVERLDPSDKLARKLRRPL